MLQHKGSVQSKWPFSWLYPNYDFSSTDLNLSDRQKSSQFLLDLGTQLHVPSPCIYTAITYMHRFLTIQSPARYSSIRLCQASMYLSCKINDIRWPVQYIYERTMKVLEKPTTAVKEEVVQFYLKEILKYEDILLSTLGFAVVIHHPHEIITQIIQQIQGSNELELLACYLATKSILFTPFCIKYPTNLIAYFCVHLAIELQNYQNKPDDQLKKRWLRSVNKSFTVEQLRSLIEEFHLMYKKCPDKYKKTVNTEDARWDTILDEKLSAYVDRMNSGKISITSKYTKGFLPSSNTAEQRPIASPRLSLTLEPTVVNSIALDHDQQMEGRISSTHQISPSTQIDVDWKLIQTMPNKRRNESSDTNDQARKRRHEEN